MVSVVAGQELSCSDICGIFPDQGLNPCPLHWRVVHSEAKQTETLVFGAEKVCCRDRQEEGWLMLQKTPSSLKGLDKTLLKARFVGEGEGGMMERIALKHVYYHM